jgi:hypothetical protein
MWGRWLFVGLLLLGGCVADVADECAKDRDCPRQRPVCGFGGVCVAPAGDGAVDAGRDALPADAGRDGAPVDAGRDATPVDAAPDGGCRPPPFPVFDDCNGIDDDCDGHVDEGTGGGAMRGCFDGPDGAEGVGVCRPGVQRCVDARWGPCDGEVLPGFETCNGQDDDCDGQVDDGPGDGTLVEECYDGPEGTAGHGMCVGGHRFCLDARGDGPCEGEVLPGQEICDGLDNDCNGHVDDVPGGCMCAPGATQACYSGPARTEGVGPCHGGMSRCDEAGLGSGPCADQVLPGVETCNGVDDDCNGTVDDVRGLGAECSVGLGACQRQGVTLCGGDGALHCQATPGQPAPEVCDGIDNDCDGRVDQTAAGAPLTRPCFDGAPPAQPGDGLCRAGTQTCRGGAWSVQCDGEVGPATEVCDGADNDCDGQVDDVAGGCTCRPGERRDCYDGPPGTAGTGMCHAGRQQCGQDGRSWGACEGEVLPMDEVCDGFDEDCDGRVDEEASDVGGPCQLNRGACSLGERACVDGVPLCQPVSNGARELCNGQDDDCDGVVDGPAADAACAAPHAQGTCQAARCRVTCDPRWADLDFDPADGCERGCGLPDNGTAVGLTTQVSADVLPAIAAGPRRWGVAWEPLDAGGGPLAVVARGAASVYFRQQGGVLVPLPPQAGEGLERPAIAATEDGFAVAAVRRNLRSNLPAGIALYEVGANDGYTTLGFEATAPGPPAVASLRIGGTRYEVLVFVQNQANVGRSLSALIRSVPDAGDPSVTSAWLGVEGDYGDVPVRPALLVVGDHLLAVAPFTGDGGSFQLRAVPFGVNGQLSGVAAVSPVVGPAPSGPVAGAVVGDTALIAHAAGNGVQLFRGTMDLSDPQHPRFGGSQTVSEDGVTYWSPSVVAGARGFTLFAMRDQQGTSTPVFHPVAPNGTPALWSPVFAAGDTAVGVQAAARDGATWLVTGRPDAALGYTLSVHAIGCE